MTLKPMYVDQVKEGRHRAKQPLLRSGDMFKFDFNIDGAEDLEEISSTAKIHSLPSEKPLLRLEPFTEILIGHLVRVNLIQLIN